jgi:hypothetical protein
MAIQSAEKSLDRKKKRPFGAFFSFRGKLLKTVVSGIFKYTIEYTKSGAVLGRFQREAPAVGHSRRNGEAASGPDAKSA